MNTTNQGKTNRKYKATLFSKLFGEDKENALSLYNAVNGSDKNMPLIHAVDRAVDECVEEGVLERFLDKHRREVKNMVLTEFDEEKFLKMVREEERAEGRTEERLETFFDAVSDLGEVPEELKECAKSVDKDTLRLWIKLAARADSMQEFLEKI